MNHLPEEVRVELLTFQETEKDAAKLQEGEFLSLNTKYDGSKPLIVMFDAKIVAPLRPSSYKDSEKWFLEVQPDTPVAINELNKNIAVAAVQSQNITCPYEINYQIKQYGNIVMNFSPRKNIKQEVTRVDGAPTSMPELEKAFKQGQKVKIFAEVSVYFTKKQDMLHIGCFMSRQNFVKQ